MERRSRIAIAYDCLFPFTKGGGERQYRAFAQHLSRDGYIVDYLTADQNPEEPLTAPDFNVIAVAPALRLYDADGVRRTSAAVIFAAHLFVALVRRRNRYRTVIVSGLPALNVIAARIALLGSRTDVVGDYLEVWGQSQWVEYAGRLVGTVGWSVQRLAIACTPIATCHSALTQARLRHERFRGTLLRSPGLIDESADWDAQPRPAADPPYVLYVGRHIPDKRVSTIPAAVAYARTRIPGLRLIILGSGPSSNDVRRAILDADGESWTDMPGFVSEQDLHRILADAACVVNPSRREGYGLVVVEAAQHGVPIVLTDDPGNAATELVEPDMNGVVAASADPITLGEALANVVLAGPDLRARAREWFNEAARERTIQQTIDQLLDVIDPNRASQQMPSNDAPGGDSRD